LIYFDFIYVSQIVNNDQHNFAEEVFNCGKAIHAGLLTNTILRMLCVWSQYVSPKR
jgi:hypothetical protein